MYYCWHMFNITVLSILYQLIVVCHYMIISSTECKDKFNLIDKYIASISDAAGSLNIVHWYANHSVHNALLYNTGDILLDDITTDYHHQYITSHIFVILWFRKLENGMPSSTIRQINIHINPFYKRFESISFQFDQDPTVELHQFH